MFGRFANRFPTRPPPPSGQPPRYVFTRYFRANLRPVVIGIGIVGAVYALIWGGSSFSNLNSDKSQNLGQLVPFDIALGAAYMAVAAIELFGIWGAIRQSLSIIRLYAMLSLVVSVISFGAEILRLVVHFKFKGPMITQCENAVQSDSNNSDIFGNHRTHGPSPQDAIDFCNDAWSHRTFSDIAWLIISLICSLVFASIAFSYYRQLLDPTSGVARTRQQDNVPLDTFRSYGQYGEYAQGTGLAYNGGAARASSAAPDYAPPYEPSKLPGYGQSYAEQVDSESGKKNTDEEKDLAGVSL